MPIWEWILVAAAIMIVVGVVIVAVGFTNGRRRTERLKLHFGPEYDRAVSESDDPRSAEKELSARVREHDKLDIVPLSPSALQEFTARWQAVQMGFVDDPARAVGEADRLVTGVMRERGYPVEDFERRAADISVDHPQVVENYRSAHEVFLAQERGDISTEHLRQAFVHYQALFGRLLETGEDTDTQKEAYA
jgi:hypothetical protein